MTEEEQVSTEDQQWLDEQVLEDRRAFPEVVYDYHQTARFARYAK